MKQVNASVMGLETNVSVNGKAINTNAKAIATVSTHILGLETNVSANAKAIATESVLTTYPCNCSNSSTGRSLCTGNNTVSLGYQVYCKHVVIRPGIFIYLPANIGWCCKLCKGTVEEAEAYARAHPPPPPPNLANCQSTGMQKLLKR